MVVTLGQQYVGEKPTIILYIYTDRYAGPPNKTKQLLRQGSVTGVILVGRPDSLGFHSVTWLFGF